MSAKCLLPVVHSGRRKMSWRGRPESYAVQTQAMCNPPGAASSRTASCEALILLTAVAPLLAATLAVVSHKPLMTPQLPRRYLMAECGPLQAALVEHANTWAAKFTDLLRRVAHKQLAASQERLTAARQALQEVRVQVSWRKTRCRDVKRRLDSVVWHAAPRVAQKVAAGRAQSRVLAAIQRMRCVPGDLHKLTCCSIGILWMLTNVAIRFILLGHCSHSVMSATIEIPLMNTVSAMSAPALHQVPQVAAAEGGVATASEVAADLAGMDEQLMDVQEKFASLQRFEARLSLAVLCGFWHSTGACAVVQGYYHRWERILMTMCFPCWSCPIHCSEGYKEDLLRAMSGTHSPCGPTVKRCVRQRRWRLTRRLATHSWACSERRRRCSALQRPLLGPDTPQITATEWPTQQAAHMNLQLSRYLIATGPHPAMNFDSANQH